MEILVTDELMGIFIFCLVLFGSILLVGIILTFTSVVELIKYFEWGILFGSFIGLLVIVTGVVCINDVLVQGVPIQYKATITDFNEVYDNGYKIVDQEGDLYILEKK